MIITKFRVMGDNRVALIDDAGINHHFMTDETAKAWMAQYASDLPTLASISPTTAVVGGADLTLTCTGTGFTADSKIIFNGGEEPTVFVSPTSLTTGVKPSLVSGPITVQVYVRTVVWPTAQKPFTFTATAGDPEPEEEGVTRKKARK